MVTSNTIASVPSDPGFGTEDIPHLGHFAAQLRLSRGINNITQLSREISVAPGIISRFEKGEIHSTPYFRGLVEKLQQERIGDIVITNPLTSDEAKLLDDLEMENRTKVKRRTLYERLNDIEIEKLHEGIGPSPSPKSRAKKQKEAPKYADLVKKLEEQPYPAFIADRLWHMHAINGAALRLFGIDPESTSGLKYMHRWEAWHVMAAKFTKPSPVRDSMLEINRYFPPTVDAFFRDICPFQFTPQARALLSQLHAMSKQNKLGFTRMWRTSVTLQSFIRQEEALYRAIVYDGVTIQGIARQRYEWTVYPQNRHPVLYWMGVWEPYDAPADKAFAELQKFSDSRKIYYAANFQPEEGSLDRPFHASAWPEVIELGTYLDSTNSF
jgi:hypothetical protein